MLRPRKCHLRLWFAILLLTMLAATAAAQSQPVHDHEAMLREAAAATPGVPSPSMSLFDRLFEIYTPRKVCMNHETDVIWVHLISDAIIAASYYSIPLALIYFVRKRKDLSFNLVFYAFAVFILACGTTHIFNIIAIWSPVYRLEGYIKALTALASIGTALALWPLLRQALLIPSPATLAAANSRLEEEVRQRTKSESDLRAMKLQLEQRVNERTAELQSLNASLSDEVAARRGAELQREQLLASERAARADAENSSRMKDDFVATLSHELRTPISAIIGWAQVLRSPAASPEDFTEGLEIIERNTRIQAQLIEDLLDMSRIISGKLRLDVQPVNLSKVIAAAIDTVRPAADAKDIRLLSVIDPLAGPVIGDPSRLQQIIWNLLSNSVKFTTRGGKVQIQLGRVNSHLEIVVSDNGIGIKPDFLPHLFERFRQADGSTTRRHGGLGLGLSIARHLVELHGGSIKAKSPGENLGSTFVVELPIASVQPHDGHSSRIHPKTEIPTIDFPSPSLDTLKILVVDDEPDARSLVKRVLEGCGATVHLAGSAKEALARFREIRPHVLLTDIGMPDTDGYSLIKQIRSWPASDGGTTPAIALTAFARAEDRRRALLAGFQMHLAKPVDPAELIATVASVSGLMGRTTNP